MGIRSSFKKAFKSVGKAVKNVSSDPFRAGTAMMTFGTSELVGAGEKIQETTQGMSAEQKQAIKDQEKQEQRAEAEARRQQSFQYQRAIESQRNSYLGKSQTDYTGDEDEESYYRPLAQKRKKLLGF